MTSYTKTGGFKGPRKAAHTGTYKGSPSISYTYGSGRRDTFYGGSGGALGKNHGHRVTTSNGFPVYDRKPGPKSQTRSTSYSLADVLFGKPKKGRR